MLLKNTQRIARYLTADFLCNLEFRDETPHHGLVISPLPLDFNIPKYMLINTKC